MEKFKIPEVFVRVVTKMNPEIVNVEVNNVERFQLFDPSTLSPKVKFIVGVKLHFDGHTWKGSRESYGEILNNLFRHTYSDESDFIRFEVITFSFPPKETNSEKFNKLFGCDKFETQ